MKYGKFLIAVIVLVAVSFSSFFVIDYYNKKNDSDNNEKNNLNLFGFNLNDVKSLEIINELEHLNLKLIMIFGKW